MEGTYKVEENINFENFLSVMGMEGEENIQKMIQATTMVGKRGVGYIVYHCFVQVTLKENADGTWTQETGLRTLTFPINEEFEVGMTSQNKYYDLF